MLKALRRKFILISLLSMGFVLTVIVGGINVANYIEVTRIADTRIDIIIESNENVFPKFDVPIHQEITPGKPQKKPSPGNEIFPEAAFDTRYFTVMFDESGNLKSSYTGKISSVDAQSAQDIANKLFSSGKQSGYVKNFRYKLIKIENENLYVFFDCERELSTFYAFLIWSVIISIVGILLVFILVLFFSRHVLKPVEETYQKQKQFISDAGHEIKTPITIISANAEVIESINGESEWTKSIKRQSSRLRDLTDKLIFLSRTEESVNSMNIYEFSLSDVIREECTSFEPLAEIEGKTLLLNIEPNIRYNGDETAICNMISILLDNALKYSNPGGSISVTLKNTGKYKELTLSNTVTQISVGKLDHFFERFYRGDKSRNSENKGYGIGLAIAKAIVNAHKGKISAKSPDGHTVIFTVVL